MSSNPTAAQLKEDGNSLFVKKEYAMASIKYTEAIAVDGKNAVLYANRAACRLALRQYLDACTDALKATELDPLYPKAHARLATSYDVLNQPSKSIDAWQRALDTLPKENLSPGEMKQLEQYQAGLKAAKAAEAGSKVISPNSYVHFGADERKNLPWHLAAAMLPELRAKKIATSSAWVIHGAYEEFVEGVGMMKALKKTLTPQGPMFSGMVGGLTSLTNGILRDSRAFHLEDTNFFQLYNDQVRLESMKTRAWTEGGPDLIIEEVQIRLRQEGWDAARPALATTIRCWLMRGFVENGLRGNPGVAVEFFSRVIEVLNWGRSAWKNVSRDDRGAIFEDTFIWGVRANYIDIYMQAYTSDPGLNSKFPLEVLYEEANDLIRDMSANHPKDIETFDAGFIYSFVVYPKGLAFAMKGFYHAEMAKLTKDDAEASFHHSRQAFMAYLLAADILPEDEEQHVWFLSCALSNMWSCGAPLRVTLPVMKRIRLAMPKMQKIWINSSTAKQGRDAKLETYLLMEKDLLTQIEEGKLTLDSCVHPVSS